MLDIAVNRSARKYTISEQCLRVMWIMGKIAFRISPKPCFGWRRFVLRCYGAKIGANVNTDPTTVIYFPWNLTVGDWTAIGENALIYNIGKVALGEKVTVSHRAHLCAGTHDYSKATMPLLKPPIIVGDQAWICAEAFVGPGVTVGEGAVVGARAVVTKNVRPWTVVAGNPSREIKSRTLDLS